MVVPPFKSAMTGESQHRARFEALRGRIFEELGRSAVRWKLTWLLPFNFFVVLLLCLRGESRGRAAAQCVALALMASVVALRLYHRHPRTKGASFILGVLSYFTFVATTGGLASPLLVLGTLMISTAAISMPDPPWLRRVVFLMFLAGYVVLALLARTQLLELRVPVEAGVVWPTAQYVSVALFGTVFTMMAIYRVGCTMTRGYERAAFELAERREELCSENEDRTRALEGMAARLAHEVKNPLAAIKGLSTHMARNTTDPKTSERLAIVAAEAERLQSIVEGFLSFSHGLDDLKLAPTRPYEVARELAVLLETRAQEAGVAIEVTGAVGLSIDADARKLRQVLLNLVLNAIQASPRGAAVEVDVAAGVCEGVRITVRDYGTGMTPEVLERIRKPYFTTKEGGTGLGVAVARGLVKQHGGRLEFTSTAGKGTTATISLPTKAKACAMLPNPARAFEREGDAEPIAAGVR